MTQRKSQVKVLKIAEFAKVSFVTPRTLRFYEQKGLIEPFKRDKFTNYRYYSLSQIDEVMKIKIFQELGLSLDEIGRGGKVDIDRRIDMLKKQIDDLKAKLAFLNFVKSFLNSREPQLEGIKVGGWRILSYEIEKGKYYEINKYINHTWKMAQRTGLKFEPREILFYETPYFSPSNSKLKVSLIVKKGSYKKMSNVRLSSSFSFEKFKSRKSYKFTYRGPYRFLTMVYRKLNSYFLKHGLPIAPPVFEIYIKGPFNTSSEYDYLTEIYYPVGL